MNLRLSAVATAIAAALAFPAATAHAGSAAAVTAEGMAGTVIGVVKEAARGVYLDGARITLDGRQVASQRDGSFRLGGIAPGRYQLHVDYIGYQPQDIEIEVGEGLGLRVDVTLLSTTADAAALDLARIDVRASRDAQAMALNQQRTSINYTNVVSADLLGQFPDNNIAESTQRIPGVSIERDQGEGRYVTVRGAPKEFTTVTIDGVQIANPDAASRGVELDTIPSDVIAALEVTKAITPDMDGDAIAGNINIRTQSALDRDGMTLRASAAQGRYQLGDGDNERYNATFGQRFGAQSNIGVLVSASYSRQGRFTDNVETTYQRFDDGRILPSEVQIKDYEGTRTRTGVTGRFDYRIDPGNLLYFVASDARFKDHEFRDNLIIGMDQHTAASDEIHGNVRATFDKELRERTYDKNIRTWNLGGEHFVGEDWKLEWQASQSRATKETSPRAQYIFRSTVRPKMDYDYTDSDFPVWTVKGRADAPATGVNLPESWFGFRRLNDRYEYGEEKENGFRVDLTGDQHLLGDSGSLKFGLRARLRDKSFDDERYRNDTAADFARLGIGMSDMLCDSQSNNFGYFNAGRRFCRDIFSRYAGSLLDSANNKRLIPDSITGDYRASEDVYAGYARMDANWDKLTMVTGLRYERTRAEGDASQFNTDTRQIQPTHASRDYGKLLPSLHFRYELDADSILRASYSTALNRPDFMHTAPYRTLGELETSAVAEGNPDVKAAYAHNLDLSWERYLRPLGLVSVAAFYKRINDPLFVATHSESIGNGLSRQVTRPENGSSGQVHGLELAWQQTFDFLPAPLDGFGVYGNYTWAKSRADLPFGKGSTELPGTSRTNYNLALTYDKHGLNARLAYNYRSRFIQSFDVDSPELNIYWDERASLDFSASYALNRNWRLFAEVNNINDSKQVRFQGKRSRVLEMEGFGRSWLGGVRYEF
ncbi:TonB-dependent receptor [Stenotrophomonas sp. MYb238]|uniref:TonB-dependent receptor n=1 Tax=Stenotrophomonas sp. MYb238 TaxID=2040281 RepID=UPI001291BD69|nr:TonB-dependent receptor [Stenotrophomonas sp. MYb238]MQP74575.1 TonB-dependent receptor [Stenotrophomonas sp. MYb238]